jgi:hypothetical protein
LNSFRARYLLRHIALSKHRRAIRCRVSNQVCYIKRDTETIVAASLNAAADRLNRTVILR